MMKVNPEDFKDPQGRRRTVSLFLETINFHTPLEPIYTLREEEHKGKPSAKKIYLEQRDPSEYRAAMALVGSWEHWQKLLNSKAIFAYIKEWREELKVILKSEAIENMHTIAGQGNPTAAKWLADQGWDAEPKQTKKGVGRPKKEPVKEDPRVKIEVAGDMERLGLTKKVN